MYQPYQAPPPRRSRPVWPWVLAGGIFAVIVIVLLYVLYWAPVPPAGRPYFGYFGGGFLLIFLLILVGFFALRMAIWSSFRSRYPGYRGGAGGPMRDPAVMTARQRYARGEITREQYDQIMTDLGRRPRGPGPYPPP